MSGSMGKRETARKPTTTRRRDSLADGAFDPVPRRVFDRVEH